MSFTTRLVAHRGWQRHYPENTLIGIAAAIAAGARHIEIDVHLTSDHQAVLCHDQLLDRISGVNININTLTLAELQQYSAFEPQRLGEKFKGTPFSTLRECADLIAKHNDVTLYVEIKRKSLFHFGQELMLQAVLPQLQAIHHRCVLISFDLAVLQRARQAGWHQVGPVLSSLEQLQSAQLLALQPDMVFCDSDLLTDSNALQSIAYPVTIYEVDRYEDARYWFEQGAAQIESFCVGELIDAFREHEDE